MPARPGQASRPPAPAGIGVAATTSMSPLGFAGKADPTAPVSAAVATVDNLPR